MRERVEDLGRLMVMIDSILDMELFHRQKQQAFEDTGTDVIIPRSDIEEVNNRLHECLEICKGEDYLNETKD